MGRSVEVSGAAKRRTKKHKTNDSSFQQDNDGERTDVESVNNDGEEDNSDDEGSSTYVSILIERGKLAAAAFDIDAAKLSFLQTTYNNNREIEMLLEKVKYQLEPCMILVSSKSTMINDNKIVPTLKKELVNLPDTGAFNVKVLKNVEFNYIRACRIIESFRIGMNYQETAELFDMNRNSDGGRIPDVYNYLCSFFDFEQKLAIRCIGALMTYLVSESIINQLERTDARISVASVLQVSLEGYMYLDPTAFQSLKIFYEEDHPSKIKGPGRSKEGFSLNGILDQCVSKPGTKLLRQWMLKPLVNESEISKRHDAVEYLMAEQQQDFVKSLTSHIKKARDIGYNIKKLKNSTSSFKDWVIIYEAVVAFLHIQNYSKTQLLISGNEIPSIFTDIVQSSNRMSQLCNLLGNVIDFEACKDEGMCVIQPDVSEELDQWKDIYYKMDTQLNEMAEELRVQYPNLPLDSVQYIPQVGYVIQLKEVETSEENSEQTAANRSKNMFKTLPDGFEFQFQENDKIRYYKNEACRSLDVNPGDVYGNIVDLSNSIIRHLTRTVLSSNDGYEFELLRLADYVATLDVLISFAKCAQMYNYKRPKIVDNSKATHIVEGRHPLQELAVKDNNPYIPNDAHIDREIACLTGQNGSGKSVFLKMVGMIHYMAQIGSFISASSESTLGIVSKIFTRIHSLETASLSQSSFTIDCNQIALMLNYMDPSSLLLIDEFGKGTAHADGLTLFAATLRYLAPYILKMKGPRVVVSTHFLQVFQNNMLDPYLLRCTNIDAKKTATPVIIPYMTVIAEKDEDAMNNVPLYTLKRGAFATTSNAFRCAAVAGIPKDVIERAKVVFDCRAASKPIPPVVFDSEIIQTEKAQKILRHFKSVSNWKTCSADKITTLMKLMDALTTSEKSKKSEAAKEK